MFLKEGFILQDNVLPIKQQQKRNPSAFSINHQQTKNIPKPQLKFTDKVDNTSQMPFIPKLRTKPNAHTPLPSKLYSHSDRFSILYILLVAFSQVDSQSFDIHLLEKHPEL